MNFFMLWLLWSMCCIYPSLAHQTDGGSLSGREFARADLREIRVSTVEALEDAIQDLHEGQTILLAGRKFHLTKNLLIDKDDVRLIGASSETTTLVCPPENNVLNINARNITVKALSIEDCRGQPAVIVIGSEKSSPAETVVFDRVSFRRNLNNQSSYLTPGGAIHARFFAHGESKSTKMDRTVKIRDCAFEDNASDVGGAIYCDGCVLDITHTRFSGNRARTSGGAICTVELESELNILHSSFQNNSVLERGLPRAVLQEDGSPIEQEVYFVFQSPVDGGGAILAETAENVHVLNTSFVSNRAPSGGAILMKMDAVDFYGRHSRIYIDIENCTFEANQATFVQKSDFNDPEHNLGGAIYFISSSADVMRFHIADSLFRDNHGQYGGGLHIIAMKSTAVDISGCTFVQNRAMKAGGAALFRNSNKISFTNTKWKKNSSGLGGAILLTNAGRLFARPLAVSMDTVPKGQNLFVRNTAQNGGGMACAGCHGLLLRNTEFVQNRAMKSGGGLCILDSAHDSSIEQSSFRDNVAAYGGGAAFQAAANVAFRAARSDWRNMFVNNTAVSGGGLFVEGNRHKENTLQMKSCHFEGNHAVGTDDLFTRTELEDMSALLSGWPAMNRDRSNGCGIGAGGGVCLIFDDVPEDAIADVQITSTDFVKNGALIGGGMFASVEGDWNDDTKIACLSNVLTAEPCRLFYMMRTAFKQNTAVYGAGGLFVSAPEKITVGCGVSHTDMEKSMTAREARNKGIQGEECFQFRNNTVSQCGGEYGPDIGSSAYALLISDPPSGEISEHTGGRRLLPPCSNSSDCGKTWRMEGIKVVIKDAFNQTITGGIPDSELSVLVLSADILGVQIYRAYNGTVNVNNTKGVGVGKRSNIEFKIEHPVGRTLIADLNFTTRKCHPGELQTEMECRRCPTNQYSFDPSSSCRDCDPHAQCNGGASFIPIDGFWHSSPFSPQFHECIIHQACVYEGRAEILEAYYHDPVIVTNDLGILEGNTQGKGTQPVYSNDKQCADGYVGVLCGSCDKGYAHLEGGECVKCPEKRHESVAWVMCSITLAFVLFLCNVFSTLDSAVEQIMAPRMIAQEGGPSRMASYRNLLQRHASEISLMSGELNNDRSSMPLPDKILQSRTIATENAIRIEKENDCAREKLRETVKILTNYLQVSSAALSINVSWSPSLEHFLSMQGLMVSDGNSVSSVPMECVFQETENDSWVHSVASTIIAFWIRIFLPIVFGLVTCVFVFTIRIAIKRKQTTSSNHQRVMGDNGSATEALLDPSHGNKELKGLDLIITVAVIVLYFSYIDVTSGFMSAINCRRVDVGKEAQSHEYGRYAVQTGSRVWLVDTSLECFHGRHLLTGVTGVAGTIWSVLSIALMIHWIRKNEKKLSDPAFLSCYGFVYEGYRTEGVAKYWEAIITIRKWCLAAVVSFLSPIGPTCQAVLIFGMLTIAFAFQLIFSPYRVSDDLPNVSEDSGWVLRIIGAKGLRDRWIRFQNHIDLNTLETGSLASSLTVYYSAIFLNDQELSSSWRQTMTCIAFTTNVFFILYILYRCYTESQRALNKYFELVESRFELDVDVFHFPKGDSPLHFVMKIVAYFTFVWRQCVFAYKNDKFAISEEEP